jgi:transaldolase
VKFFIDTANGKDIREAASLGVVDAAPAGARIATIPFRVIDQLVKHPLTAIGIETFLADGKKLEKK